MEKKAKVRRGVRITRPTVCVRGSPKFGPRFWCEGGSELAVRHFAKGGRQNLDPARDAKGGQSWPSDTLQMGVAKTLPLSKVRRGVESSCPTLLQRGSESLDLTAKGGHQFGRGVDEPCSRTSECWIFQKKICFCTTYFQFFFARKTS